MTSTVNIVPGAGRRVVEDLGVALVDADTHYYEPLDAITRHLDPKLAKRIYRYVTTEEGDTRLLINGRMLRLVSDPTFDPCALPGSLLNLFKNGGDASFREAFAVQEKLTSHPEFFNREARLTFMDEQSVQTALVLPTVGVCIEEYLREEPDLTVAALHAFNLWLEEDWGLGGGGRIFGVPLISLIDPGAAVRELRWALDRGARIVHLRPCPVPGGARGRSLADPMFEPFWELANEAGIAVAFHLADAGQRSRYASDWGEVANPGATEITRFHLMGDYRAAYDTLADVLLHGLFDKFPRLRFAFIELGAEWVSFFLKNLQKVNRRDDRARLTTALNPIEALHEHIYFTPYPEEDVHLVLETLSVERVIFGSDFPHVEGCATPSDFFDELGDLPASTLRKLAGENTSSLLGPPR